VASGAGGALELGEHGSTLLYHAPGDVADLARTIETLVADAGLRARLGAAAHAHAVRRFDRARYAREVRAIHQSLATERRPAGALEGRP
jgi:glycosyltransferase involved in cell wall biosynthesis